MSKQDLYGKEHKYYFNQEKHEEKELKAYILVKHETRHIIRSR